MLKSGTCYCDLGPNHFDRRTNHNQATRLVNRLQTLGFNVQISPAGA